MKKQMFLLGFAAVLGLAAPASAAADTWTAWFTIDYLDNGDSGSNDTVTVSSASGDFTGSTLNPAGCTGDLGYAYMQSSATAAAKDAMNKLLLAAFLAGKQVRLRMNGTTCLGNSPMFKFVAIQ